MADSNNCLCLYFDDFSMWQDSSVFNNQNFIQASYNCWIFPNPIDDYLNYKTNLDNASNTSLVLYSLSGQLLFQQQLNRSSGSIFLGKKKHRGPLFAVIQINNQTIFRKQIVINP